MYKLLNKKLNKYLACLNSKTADGTYTVVLLEDGSSLPAIYVWDKQLTHLVDGEFTLYIKSLDASLVRLGDEYPDDAGTSFAWAARADYAPPVKMLADGSTSDISLNTGPIYLTGHENNPYVYFDRGRGPGDDDVWEFQPV